MRKVKVTISNIRDFLKNVFSKPNKGEITIIGDQNLTIDIEEFRNKKVKSINLFEGVSFGRGEENLALIIKLSDRRIYCFQLTRGLYLTLRRFVEPEKCREGQIIKGEYLAAALKWKEITLGKIPPDEINVFDL